MYSYVHSTSWGYKHNKLINIISDTTIFRVYTPKRCLPLYAERRNTINRTFQDNRTDDMVTWGYVNENKDFILIFYSLLFFVVKNKNGWTQSMSLFELKLS
jgi:hypothetical protein